LHRLGFRSFRGHNARLRIIAGFLHSAQADCLGHVPVAWLAARGAGWLAGARIVYRLASGWLAGGRVAGWLALACVACAGVASGSLSGQSGGRERPQAGGRARDLTRGG